MRRHAAVRRLYPVLRLVANCYFWLVNALFSLYNSFFSAKCVQWENASELLFIPAHRAAEMIRSGKLKSTDLVSAYIERQKQVVPTINAIAHERYEKAMAEAKEVDDKLAQMSDEEKMKLAEEKPLFGVPFTSKENLNAEGFVTVSGNKALSDGGKVADADAEVLRRLRAAGGILTGITTMPNLGLSWATDDTFHGRANNPHDTRRMTGGSSGGEGSIISAGGSLFGIGNDIAGSIRIPAYMNGVFGLKPTSQLPGSEDPHHLIPTGGLVPEIFLELKYALLQLSNGPLCRYAQDLPLVLSIMAGKNREQYEAEVDFSGDFNLFYMEDLNIWISENLDPEVREGVRKVRSHFETKFGKHVQRVDFPLMHHIYELWGLWGFGDERIDFSLGTLWDKFWSIYRGKMDKTFLGWESDILRCFVEPQSEEERQFVVEKKEKLRGQLCKLLGSNGVLLLPTWPTTAHFHHMEPFVEFNMRYTIMFNVIGFPALTAPAGKSSEQLPLGVQFVAAPDNEHLLCAVAKEVERAFGGWAKPGKEVEPTGSGNLQQNGPVRVQ